MDENKKITLKLIVDKEKNKVLFAESDEYFVQVLFSFLSYPIGAISKNSSKNAMIGCIDCLYKSVEALDLKYFQSESCKDKLIHPRWFCSTKSHCFIHLRQRLDCIGCTKKLAEVIPMDSNEKFIISDDLCVKKVCVETGLQTFCRFGIKDASAVEERTFDVGKEEVWDLLKLSFVSQSPITDLVLKLEDISRNPKRIKTEPLNKQCQKLDQGLLESLSKISVKLLIRRSENKVLYAVANEEFVNLLFSILFYPIEALIKLFPGHFSSVGSMDNLYKSEGNLCQEEPEKFKRQEKMSFDPKRDGGFLKGPAIFMITDDLEVKPFSTVSSFSFINKLGIPLSDLEERSARVGEQEALSVIKSLLTTKSVLTTVFCPKN